MISRDVIFLLSIFGRYQYKNPFTGSVIRNLVKGKLGRIWKKLFLISYMGILSQLLSEKMEKTTKNCWDRLRIGRYFKESLPT